MIIFETFNQFPSEFPIVTTLICTVVAFILGIVWYNPKLLGEKATEARHSELNGYKPTVLVYATAFVLWFITACVYSFLTGFLNPPSIQALLGLSTFLWVGFTLPAVMLNGLLSGKKLMVMAVDSSYFLAGLYLFAVIHDVMK